MRTCEIKILVWRDHGDGPMVLECFKSFDHDGEEHEGKLYMTKVIWLTDDRRSFVGELELCHELDDHCVLPLNHHGDHAS